MSQAGILNTGTSGGGSGVVETLTGNSGGAVSPDSAFNINVVGSGTISVAGNPGTHTLTISSSGPTYASGTWTPTLAGSSTAGTAVYATQTGFWYSVGAIVYCEMFINITSLTGGVGNLVLGGLPFTVSNSVGLDPIVPFFNANSKCTFGVTPITLGFQLNHNTTTANAVEMSGTVSTANAITDLAVSFLQGSDTFSSSFFYFM